MPLPPTLGPPPPTLTLPSIQGVVRYRKQRPKIHMFSRLIGVDNTMTAIPHTAIHTPAL